MLRGGKQKSIKKPCQLGVLDAADAAAHPDTKFRREETVI